MLLLHNAHASRRVYPGGLPKTAGINPAARQEAHLFLQSVGVASNFFHGSDDLDNVRVAAEKHGMVQYHAPLVRVVRVG